uniref:7K protein B, p7b n=1 Tax=Beet black scorch virus TaxID=196375 RepID=D1GV21_9TOMB|nr:7K protein B, p7b [Beet black scorch virus]CBA34990.1 7K protein B, p7b [Beet black scorch virus]
MSTIYVVHEKPSGFLVWAFVVAIVCIIGLLSYTPPERLNHSYHENNQKTQYITIGGASTSKVSTN